MNRIYLFVLLANVETNDRYASIIQNKSQHLYFIILMASQIISIKQQTKLICIVAHILFLLSPI